MALQLRRGSDAERVAITFAEGELVYTTDTKKLYVGDGTTAGGISATAYVDSSPGELNKDLDLNEFSILGTGTVNITGTITATSASLPLITVNQITNTLGSYEFKNSSVGLENQIILSSVNNLSGIKLVAESTTDLSTSDLTYGRILFERNDLNGSVTTAVIDGGNSYISFVVANDGDFSNVSDFLVWRDAKLGLGTNNPAEKLDVRGNAVVQGYTKFGSYTTLERGALTPQNGMVIYNTTDNRFQGVQNGAWINLDDGSAAI